MFELMHWLGEHFQRSPRFFWAAVIAGIAIAVIVIVLGPMPYKIARNRKHPDLVAIGITNLVAIFFPLCWVMALIWALVDSNQRMPSPVSLLDVILPKPPASNRNESTARDQTGVSQTAAMWGHAGKSEDVAKQPPDRGPADIL